MLLKIPFYGGILENLINIISFDQKDEDQIQYKKYQRGYYRPSQAGPFAFHVHESPNNIIGFDYRKNDEYPVQQVHGDEIPHIQGFGF